MIIKDLLSGFCAFAESEFVFDDGVAEIEEAVFELADAVVDAFVVFFCCDPRIAARKTFDQIQEAFDFRVDAVYRSFAF